MQRVTQQHGSGENGSHGIGNPLARDIRRAAVNRLVETRIRTDGCRRQHTDGTTDHSGLIGENVAEKVSCHNHVELRGADGELHRAVIHIEIVERDFRISFGHLRRRTAPQARGCKHVRLIDGRDLAAAQLRRFKGELRDAFDLRHGIVLEIPGALAALVLLGLAFVAEIDSADELTHDDEIDPLGEFWLER